MEPLISVITVCFNAEKAIVPTMESVASQNFASFEHIIVDGASTDTTLEVANKLRLSSTVILSEKDTGIYDAMNKGLKMAKGQYVVFLNAGDSFHSPDVLKRVSEASISKPGVIYGQTVIVDAQRNQVGPRHLTAPEVLSFASFANGMMVCHQAFFARKDLAPKFDEKYKFSADYDWCVRILRESQENVYLGNEPIVDYLNEGATSRNRLASLKERFSIMAKHYGKLPTVLRHFKFMVRSLKIKL